MKSISFFVFLFLMTASVFAQQFSGRSVLKLESVGTAGSSSFENPQMVATVDLAKNSLSMLAKSQMFLRYASAADQVLLSDVLAIPMNRLFSVEVDFSSAGFDFTNDFTRTNVSLPANLMFNNKVTAVTATGNWTKENDQLVLSLNIPFSLSGMGLSTGNHSDKCSDTFSLQVPAVTLALRP